MKRRGFLKAILAGISSPIIAQASPLIQSNDIKEVKYTTLTFKRKPQFFDIVTYTGTGQISRQIPRQEFEPSLIIVKCTTMVSPWYVLSETLNGLPNDVNLDGHTYIAYEFGEEARSIINPYLVSNNFITLK